MSDKLVVNLCVLGFTILHLCTATSHFAELAVPLLLSLFMQRFHLSGRAAYRCHLSPLPFKFVE